MECNSKSSVNILCVVCSTDPGQYVRCNQAFLFSMVNPSGLGPTKLPLIPGQEEYGICCNYTCGPVFGRGHDLCIPGNANINTYSSSNLGSSYQRPLGQQNRFFTGSSFTVTDYEVFGLHK